MLTLILVTLVVATVTTGLSAGVFFAFDTSVMPGLRDQDDARFVAVMRSFNTRIQNPWFLTVLLAAPLLSVLSLVFALFDAKPVGPTALAAATGLVSLGITIAVNIPLNNLLDSEPDPARARRAFERRWTRWNLIRTWVSTASLGCLCLALLSA